MRLLPDIGFSRGTSLQPITFRGFPGGLNRIDDDISMRPQFVVDAKNVVRDPSGAMSIRYGTRWFADGTGTATGTSIIDVEYFNGRLVCVTNTGQVFTVNESGTKVLIWSSVIAAALPGAPAGWGTVTQVDFVPFRNTLVIHNGSDKPISISSSFVVTYLQDLASGSNINTPIGKYGCTVSNYHCVAGISGSPTLIYISNKGTSGTFPGDAAPNDAISVDVGAYAPEGSNEIRGIAGFRTALIVFFVSRALVITLGNYNTDDVHVPEFPDELPQFGLLGHRCIATLPADLHFANFFGVSSAKRSLFSGLFDAQQLSEIIEPDYRSDVDDMTDTQQQRNSFVLYDPLNHTTMTFFPSGKVHVYCHNEQPQKYNAWTYFEDMTYTCGAVSTLGRIFLCSGMRIFQLGNGIYSDENHHADREYDRDGNWATGTLFAAGYIAYDSVGDKVYECNVTHTSGAGTFAQDRTNHPDYWTEYLGEDINWQIETPWVDGQDPMKMKQLKFGQVATKGTAEFTLKVYVDNLKLDEEGNNLHDPALTVNLIGNDAAGYGADAGPMGGGLPSRDPRLIGMPVKFKTIKYQFSGETKKPLTIAGHSYLFHKARGFKR